MSDEVIINADYLQKLYEAELLKRYEAQFDNVFEVQAKRIAKLEAAFREIYEVYAGSEGFIPETAPEGYQQQLIKEMAEIAAEHMRKGK